MRKICVITGSRAEYGLLKLIIQGIKDDPDLLLQLVVTGMHLSPEFGYTYKIIEQDGFKIDYKVETLMSSDSVIGISKSMGLGLIGFADALNELKPDLIIVLGDRFEIFSVASVALVTKIPIAHIHGGEITQGAFDDAFRHCITKMAHLHFVAAEPYQKRVIQLGEKPDYVFLVGGLGVDNIKTLNLLKKKELEEQLNFRFKSKNLLITFHPVTLDNIDSDIQMRELLISLSELNDTQLIFTLPNADNNSRNLIKMITDFVDVNSNALVFKNLGQLLYLSLIPHVDAVIGNSSSGLLEVPSFKVATVNIGSRQNGRLKAKSVIDCEPISKNISCALKKVYSSEFQINLKNTINPYGEGGASKKILEIIKHHNLTGITLKHFNDLDF